MSAEQQREIRFKVNRIVDLLRAEHQQALLIRRNENLAWITAGCLARRVLLPSDTNVAAVLITRDGQRYYLTTNNEAARLAQEDFFDLGFQAMVVPWHASGFEDTVRNLVGLSACITDHPYGDSPVVDLTPLRTPLLDDEITRYRALGLDVANTVSLILQKLKPGMSEHQMNAMVASSLWAAGIEPSVLLMAVDERIMKYKHAVGNGQELHRFGMINLCARRHGLAISITRFVHFGPMPQQLVDAFYIATTANAALLAMTRAGVTAGQLYQVAQEAYAVAGFPGEEEFHHQGGAAGYSERDWVATPGGSQVVANAQAFAWNASIRGGKVEDTVLLQDGRIELLTPTPALPMVRTAVGRQEYVSAGVLLR
jgi:antitoxin VapB